MSENIQKKLPIIMLALVMLASVAEMASQYYGSAEVKVMVQKVHIILAIVVLIISLFLVYLKFIQKKRS